MSVGGFVPAIVVAPASVGGAAIRLRKPVVAGGGDIIVGFAAERPPEKRRAARLRSHAEEGGGTTTTSFYQVLGIDAGESAEGIKRAYRRLARKYHPDVSPPSMAEEHARRFIELREAYQTLSEPGRRAAYDDLLAGHPRQEAHEGNEWRTRWQGQLENLERMGRRRRSWRSKMS